jgi:hypothetical protein
MIALRPAAAERVDRFAVANPSGTIAVVSGSTLLDAAPLNLPPFHGRFSLDDPRWTLSDAQHLVDALGGHDITRDPGFHPAPTSPSG